MSIGIGFGATTATPQAELAYAEITSDFTTTSTSFVDVTGLNVTVTAIGRPLLIVFDCGNANQVTAAAGIDVKLLEASTDIGHIVVTLNPAIFGWCMHREVRRTPSAGSVAYKVQVKSPSAGTVTLGGAAASGPASLRVVQL